MNKLKSYKFSDLYTLSSGISTSPDQAGHGYPFVSFSTVFNNYFLPENLSDLMQTSDSERKQFSVRNGDIFLTRTSETLDELCMSCVAIKDIKNATFSGFLKRLRPNQADKTYHLFMGFYLRSEYFRKMINNNAIMTLRASFNEKIFSYLKLLLPNYKSQKLIGDLLYSIQQKIENNNKINSQLEAMTKLIYDYWFVQFDFPDENGKPYKSSGGKMVFNEDLNREIPYGWKVQDFGINNEIRRGNLITSDTIKNGKVKLVSAGVKSSHFHDQANRSANVITISSSGANAGYVNFWREPIFASDCITVQATNIVETILSFQFLKMIQNHIYRKASGSAQPHVYPSDLFNLKYLLPPKNVIDLFERKLISSNDLIGCQNQENDKLKELRDWLLPMLMNGQVTVSETS